MAPKRDRGYKDKCVPVQGAESKIGLKRFIKISQPVDC